MDGNTLGRIGLAAAVAVAAGIGAVAVARRGTSRQEQERPDRAAVAVASPPSSNAWSAKLSGRYTVRRYQEGRLVGTRTGSNAFLGSGIRLVWGLITGDSSAVFDDSSYIGVGSSGTATDTSMTGLQGDSTCIVKVDSHSLSGATATWWATVDSTRARWAWREFCLFRDSGATALNRAVYDHGIHPADEVWVIEYELTLE